MKLPLDTIIASPHNRKKFDPDKLAELAESIKEFGVLQEIGVRQIAGKPPMYEIIFGERRWRASQLAGVEDIPAKVLDVTEGMAHKLRLLENVQREDVHPIEEAELMQLCLADTSLYGTGQAAVKALAAEIGKSKEYVYSRLKLLSLTEEARQEFLEGNLTAGHAVIIARLSPESQYECLTAILWERTYHGGRYVRSKKRSTGEMSVRALQNFVGDLVRDLQKAPWSKSDGTLLPQAGACFLCPKRTGVDADLTGEKKDLCLDLVCWNAKGQAHRDSLIASALAAEPGIQRVSTNYNSDREGVLPYSKFDWVKENTPGAVKALVVEASQYETDKVGTIGWISLSGGSRQPTKTREEIEEEKEEKRKLDIEKEYRFQILLHGSRAIDGRGAIQALRELLKLQALTAPHAVEYAKKAAKITADVSVELLPIETVVGLLVGSRVASEIVDLHRWNVSQRPAGLLHLAKLTGLDLDALKLDAEAKFPKKEPKAKAVSTSTNAKVGAK